MEERFDWTKSYQSWLQRKRSVVEKLGELDKSRAGGPDAHILSLLDTINASPFMYSTSSCAGRTILAETVPETHSRGGVNWLYVNHEPTCTADVVWSALGRMSDTKGAEVWWKLEGGIIHVCVDSIEHAHTLIHVAKTAGFKRSGIIASNKRVVCELVETHRVEAVVAKNGEVVMPKEYMEVLCDASNGKLHAVHARLEDLRTKLLASPLYTPS